MTDMNREMHKNLLLALRSHLRGEANLVMNTAMNTILDEAVAKRPAGACRSCKMFWRTQLARALNAFAMDLIQFKEELLERIEKALHRLEDGKYGVCAGCDEPIPEASLLAAPYATLCVVCDPQLGLAQ
jgi:RNA polymerase-binding transcription factor DksA